MGSWGGENEWMDECRWEMNGWKFLFSFANMLRWMKGEKRGEKSAQPTAENIQAREQGYLRG